MKKKYPPQIEVIDIQQQTVLLSGSGEGGGNMPPTENDNSDNDW